MIWFLLIPTMVALVISLVCAAREARHAFHGFTRIRNEFRAARPAFRVGVSRNGRDLHLSTFNLQPTRP